MKRIGFFFAISLWITTLPACTDLPVRMPASDVPPTEVSKTFAQLQESELAVVRDPAYATRVYTNGERSKKSVLIMHGLHESPASMQGFAEDYYQHGYNVVSLRLPGHQTLDREGLNQVRFTEWIDAAEQGLQIAHELGDEVEVLGYSTGGTLGMYLALEHPDDIKKLVLVAPALALTDQVFLSSALLGHSAEDAGKICTKPDSKNWLCRILLFSDDQIEPMLKEGLLLSPSAGLQVQLLIEATANRFSGDPARPEPASGPAKTYYQRLKDTYENLKAPLVMINTENDNITRWKFNHEFAESYKGPKAILLFKKDQGITHIMINKSELDAFKNTPGIHNPEFQQMLDLIHSVPNNSER